MYLLTLLLILLTYLQLGHFSAKYHEKFGIFVNFSGKYHKNSGNLVIVRANIM